MLSRFGRQPLYTQIVLQGQLQEEPVKSSWFFTSQRRDFRRLLEQLQAVRRHERLQVLVLHIKSVSLSWNQVEEIHEELDALAVAGKQCWAFLEEADNRIYYLACGCQRILMPPSATIELIGLRAERYFFRDLLTSVGVQPEFFSVGEFKSAMETVTHSRMSEFHRQMTEALLKDIQQQLLERVARQRHVPREQAQQWIDNGPYTARRALEQGLVDQLLYEDELEAALQQVLPQMRSLSAAKLRVREGLLARATTFYRPQIAYIVADGIITPGESKRLFGRRPTVGTETLKRLLKQASNRKRVRAVVLRINSPGGAAVASDLIWREVQMTDRKKPVIASLAGTAASGGYYIAIGARKIVAMTSSLTGSIGVVGGKFNAQRLLDRLHIGVDALDMGNRAGYRALSRAYSAEEAEVVEMQLRDFYQLFLQRVAQGRHKTLDEIEAVARGRVWTGKRALECGLIDEIGGLQRAVHIARREAGLSEHQKIRILPLAKKAGFLRSFSVSLLHALERTRIWALLPECWIIR